MASNHDILLPNAAFKTLNFQTSYSNALKGGKFPKEDIIEILQQPGCVALRYYFALDNTTNTNAIHIILCGVNSEGNDMLPSEGSQGKLKDNAITCPPYCGAPNELNHI